MEITQLTSEMIKQYENILFENIINVQIFILLFLKSSCFFFVLLQVLLKNMKFIYVLIPCNI